MDVDAQQKWNRIYLDSEVGSYSVSKILQDHQYLLPSNGVALDLACGVGSDAIYLARSGLEVQAWDISDEVVAKLNQYAEANQLSVVADARDITVNPPSENSFDVISVAHFLDRTIVGDLIAALKPGGLIFYQTFLKEVTSDYSGPSNPDFRLGKNEMLHLFSELTLLYYQEDGLVGNLQYGFRNEVMLIAQKL